MAGRAPGGGRSPGGTDQGAGLEGRNGSKPSGLAQVLLMKGLCAQAAACGVVASSRQYGQGGEVAHTAVCFMECS
jgi:hypothetical protein